MSDQRQPRDTEVARRTFLSRLAAGAAAFGAAFGGASIASAQSPQAAAPAVTDFHPQRYPQDAWYDETPAKHRFFMDTTSHAAAAQALGFGRNFLEANKSGYGLTDADIAEIICLRHQSTPFAYNDAMWAKYGPELSERAGGFLDPKTQKPPTANPLDGDANGRGVTISLMAKRGVRYAVCAMATRRAATLIASKHGMTVDAAFKELSDNLVPNAHLVTAGILAVNRAQEHGYTSLSVVPTAGHE